MKSVREKQYLEDIISQELKNYKNIQSKTNRASRIVNKISSTHGKKTNDLKYILQEDIISTISQVFEAFKNDSREGDFYDFVQKDLEDLNIDLSEEDMQILTKSQWKLDEVAF